MERHFHLNMISLPLFNMIFMAHQQIDANHCSAWVLYYPCVPPACGVSWQDGTPGKKYLQVVASGTPACLERPTTTATSLAGLLASGS